jgi:rod shape-determining protein MreC
VRERHYAVWLLLGVALIVVLNLPDSMTKRGKAAIRDFLAPLQELVTRGQQQSGQWLGAIQELGELAVENQEMAAELTRLRSEIRYLEALQDENRALRTQLGFLSRPDYALIPTEVIGRDVSGWWQSVRVGKGLAEGIESDMAVVTPDGVVGRIDAVSAGTADILLISDPGSTLAAHLPVADAFGILSGDGISARGAARLEMRFINKNARIELGEEVVTSGLGGDFPRGLLIGYITAVTMDESGLYQRATVTPSADLGRLAYCFVIAETPDPVETLLRPRTGPPAPAEATP